MTREEARQAAEVMMAYAEGREVEYYDVIDECWDSSGDLGFNWFDTKYRVKPEPKYRPFHNVEECWDEMQKHQPFGWLKAKTSTQIYSAYEVSETSDWVYRFNTYTFVDGTPYGIKEE